jgi:hypothetical protein
MRLAAAAQGFHMGPGNRACIVHERRRSTIHFTERCLSAEVISHEACHAAQKIVELKGTRKFRNPKEDLPFWTGQMTRAIVDWLYEENLYKRRK